jgi:hypothetical protein
MQTNIDQEVMGQKIKINMQSDYAMEVISVDEEVRKIVTSFDRVKMNMNMVGVEMNFDTDKKATDEANPLTATMNKIFSVMAGKKFTMRVNAEGKVESVSGLRESMVAVLDTLGLREGERDEAMAQFNKQFNEESIRSQFERVLYVFPNKEVKVGDSWQKNSAIAGQMGGKYNSTYTVKEMDGNMVTLSEKSTISSQEEGVDLQGTVDGNLLIDSKTGLVVSAEQQLEFTVKNNAQSFTITATNKIKGRGR